MQQIHVHTFFMAQFKIANVDLCPISLKKSNHTNIFYSDDLQISLITVEITNQ